jgi:hypothetical protein
MAKKSVVQSVRVVPSKKTDQSRSRSSIDWAGHVGSSRNIPVRYVGMSGMALT